MNKTLEYIKENLKKEADSSNEDALRMVSDLEKIEALLSKFAARGNLGDVVALLGTEGNNFDKADCMTRAFILVKALADAFGLTTEKRNTIVRYLYRDASNYKVHSEVIVSGVLTAAEKRDIFSSLDCGEYFIPKLVGLPENRFSDYTEDDGPFFELSADSFEETTESPTGEVDVADVHEMAARFTQHKNAWF